VIGAGPAGLTAAYKLLQKGHHVVVFEKGNAVGGMAKTIELWGQLVDLGPHRFFSSDSRVNSLWVEAVGNDYKMVSRLTRIYYRKTFFDYPLKAFNALTKLGVFESFRCILSYLASKVFPQKNESSFEVWVINRFGARLFSIFFRSYSEKLWGISCKELDADFAAQRIKKMSLFEAIKSAFFGNDGKHKTLVDEFAYPARGAGAVYARMAEQIEKMSGHVLLNAPVADIRLPQDTGADNEKARITLPDGRMFEFDHIISSMPIDELVRAMKAPSEILSYVRALRFRNTILVYLLLGGSSPFPDQWIYVHSPDLRTGRISNFRNWVPTICRGQPDTILCLEYWCYNEDILWREDETVLIEQAMRELHSTGLVSGNSVKDGKVVRIPKCYPVYNSGYRNHLEPVEKYLSGVPNLSVIGRYGAFKYNNQDHSILMGLLAAENISEGKSHDLWQVNTDYEYQESTRITATGLGKV
jgi:protoporphyrinogen oxidase